MVSKAGSAAAKQKKPMFTKEEELLLKDFSSSLSRTSSMIFYFNAFMVSVIPVWLYWRIHMVDFLPSSLIFLAVTAISTYLISMAYKNSKFMFKHKMAQKLDEAVTKAISDEISEKKMSTKEKDDRILWKKNEVADAKATNFSLFYNNALFLVITIIGSFLIFRSMTPTYNYMFSVLSASGLAALLSSGTQ